MIQISSLQVGKIQTEGDPESRDVTRRQWTSAFRKVPVQGMVGLGRLGVEGDQVADTKHHGGVDKAVLCYAESSYPKWTAEQPELEFSAGGFGENLTLSGVDESTVCVGDRYRIDASEIEVCQPRQPCWKVARRWGDKTMTKRVAQTGRTGWYARVLQPGQICQGMSLELVQRPHPDWTIQRINDLMYGRLVDRAATLELMQIDALSDEWKKDIA